MNKFSRISKSRLNECHPDLQHLMEHVLVRRDISIACGHRTEAEQNAAYDGGYSKLKYPRSKHNSFPSRAVDIIPYPEGYKATKEQWAELGRIVKEEAELLGISIVWGGDWQRFKDRPHWELP